MMNDKPSYVFKSSKEMAQLMLKMDQNNDESHPLQDEVVYFDGMHKRCAGYKTPIQVLSYNSLVVPAKMCQSYQSLPIAHSVHERIGS